MDDSSTARAREPKGSAARWSLGLVGLAVLVAAVFGPTLGHGFVWDDHEQVVENEALTTWSTFSRIWTEDVLSLSRADGERSNYYRPLFFLQYLVYHQLFGADPFVWHFLALAWHLAVCIAVWRFAVALGLDVSTGWVVAALFCVHPAHGESVGWVAAAFNDPPAAFGVLVGLVFHLRWIKRGHWIDLSAAAAGFAWGLLTKEAALCFLVLVPLVDSVASPSGRSRWLGWGRAGLATLPFLYLLVGREQPPDAPWLLGVAQLVIGLLLALLWARLRGRPVARQEWSDALFVGIVCVYLALRLEMIGTVAGRFEGAVGWSETLWTLPSLLLFYVRALFWPFGLGPSYSYRWVGGPMELQAWGAVVVLGLVVAITWILSRRLSPWVGWGMAWVAACLWPALNVRGFRETYLVHQRYLYLAVLGLCVALAVVLRQRVPNPVPRLLSVVLLIGIWSGSTIYHHQFWSDDVALWQRIVALDPGNAAGWDWLGADAFERGRVDEAERSFRASIEADPSSPIGHRNLALLLHRERRDVGAALRHYRLARERFESSGEADSDLAKRNSLNIATCRAELGEVDEAIAAMRELNLRPPFLRESFHNLAVLEVRAGRRDRAAEVLTEAQRRFPEDPRWTQMLRQLGARPPGGSE